VANDLDVRIVLGKLFSEKDVINERKNLQNLADKYGLKLGENIRYIRGVTTRRFETRSGRPDRARRGK